MRVTIIKDDNAVNVDGVRRTVDLNALPAEVHAVQWDGIKGEVEYRMTRCDHCGARQKRGNEFITDLSPYQTYVDGWNVADAEAKAAERARSATGQEH